MVTTRLAAAARPGSPVWAQEHHQNLGEKCRLFHSCFCRFAEQATTYGAETLVKSATPNVTRIILTARCMDGVGKSTIALSQARAKVRLFGADIYDSSWTHK
jgi:Mrp family chromosome partitioning ATPase